MDVDRAGQPPPQIGGQLAIRIGFDPRRQHHRPDPHRIDAVIDLHLTEPGAGGEIVAQRVPDLTLRHRLEGDAAQAGAERDRQQADRHREQHELPAGMVRRQVTAEAVAACDERGGQRDGDRIGQEQQQRAGEDDPVPRRDPEADHDQRRHQRDRDGDAYYRAAPPADQRITAGDRGEQRDEQVE